MQRSRWNLPAALVVTALAAGCGGGAPATTTADAAAALEGRVVTVHKTPTCGCCGEYEEYLETHGLEVVVEEHDDLDPIKAGFGVPADLRSCHTNEIDGYGVEGHVPIEALADLLEQAPDVDGIALGGMPKGSPGMPGDQEEPFDVRLFTDAADAGQLGEY